MTPTATTTTPRTEQCWDCDAPVPADQMGRSAIYGTPQCPKCAHAEWEYETADDLDL